MILSDIFPSKGSSSSAKKPDESVRLSLFFRKYRRWILLGLLSLILLFFLFGETESAQTPQEASVDLASYAQSLRKELEDTLSQMAGVGKCTVLITFSDGGETVYAYDEDLTTSESGTKSEDRQYVLISSRSDGLVLKVYTPAVRGVAVICEGGDLARVKSDVTEVLSGTLGISSDRISVKKRIVQE